MVRGKKYRTFTVSYFANGKRQRQQFRDFEEANTEATNIADQKAQGALGAAALSAGDRVALQDSLTKLAEQEGTGDATVSRLIRIVADYTTANKELPKGATLTEAARYYAQRHPANMPKKTLAEVVREFIDDRRSAGCSEVHLHDLESRLGQFKHTFDLPINHVSPPLVQRWLYDLKRGKDNKPASARTKENMLRMISSLFNYARRMKFVPADVAMEIAEIPTPKKQPAPIGVYTAAEIESMLAKADTDAVPALAIAAFAGLRLAEVARLDWRDVRLGEKLIVVEARNAKTAARRLVPIQDNLAAWLAPHAKRFGPMNPCQEERHCVGNALGDRFERAAGRAKVKWKRNGFRHTYISARVATLKDVPEVALEAGNSPAIIFSNYRALLTETEGKAWFAVMPPQRPGNVVPAPAADAA